MLVTIYASNSPSGRAYMTRERTPTSIGSNMSGLFVFRSVAHSFLVSLAPLLPAAG